MRPDIQRLTSAVVIALGTAVPAAGQAGQAGQTPPPGTAITAPATAQIEALIAEKTSRTDAQNRIDSSLLYKLKASQGLLAAAGLASMQVASEAAGDGREIVDVTARDGFGLIPAVQRLGADVLFADALMLRLRVSLSSLEAIAELPDVVFVQPPLLPRRQSVRPAAGIQQLPQAVADITSEGDVVHRAATARSTYGVTGAGIKVGVLSNGVDGLADAQAAGALGSVTVLSGQAGQGQGNEGTAMLEIVHDLAPGAELFFATGGMSTTQFAANIRALQAAGCQIIVDDVGFSNESPFQDGQTGSVISTTNAGVVIQAVKDVTAAGVLYLSAAANSGNVNSGSSGTWEGDFTDSGVTFNSGRKGIAHLFGIRPGASIPANYLTIVGHEVDLYWSDPLGGSNNDYDIYILDANSGLVKTASTNLQNGTQDPFERVSGNALAPNDQIVVVKFSGSARFLHLDTSQGALFFGTEGSTHGHAATSAANSLGVAAAPARAPVPSRPNCASPTGPYPNAFTTGTRVECFSSDGNRRIFFNGDGTPVTPNNFLAATSGGRVLLKPDVTAADGVAVSGAGFDASKPPDNIRTPFFGTSAAAPHAAAIAALVWSRNRTQTASDVKAALLASALDIMGPGRDRDSGAGIIMADTAVAAAAPGPTMSLERASVIMSAVSTGTAFTASAPPQTARLKQAGAGAVTWTAASSAPWLTVTPASGSGAAVLTIAVRFDPTLPASGTVTGNITITLTGAGNTLGPIAVTLNLVPSTAAPSPPFGSFDTPSGDATVLAGSIALTGWTLDNIGVKQVELWRDLQPGETTPPGNSTPGDPRNGKIFIANATFVDNARPDVEGVNPTIPANYRAGWGYLMLTWGLFGQGNGTYKFHAFGVDQEGNTATMGTKTVIISNNTATKPFGSIDTPTIGGDASGPNFGWGLTPTVAGAATCRIQASGVQYSIDSGPLQPVVYGDARTDIAGAFPGFSNTAAAGGHAIIDWTTLTNATHTIGWLITDDCNRADGVGSRFFNNPTGTALRAAETEASPDVDFRLKAETTQFGPVASAFRRNGAADEASASRRKPAEEEASAAVLLARGYGELSETVRPGLDGSRIVRMNQSERIELRLPRGFESAFQLGPGGERRALPIGSSWDAVNQTFYWQPAAGFLGPFRLVFGNGHERMTVLVVVVP